MELGRFLKESREHCLLSQSAAASAIGVSLTTIQNWEYGFSVPDQVNIKKLSEVYNILPSQVMAVRGAELDKGCLAGQKESLEATNRAAFNAITHLLPEGYTYEHYEALFLTKAETEVVLALKLSLELNTDPFVVFNTLGSTSFDLLCIIDDLKSNAFIAHEGIRVGSNDMGGIYKRQLILLEKGEQYIRRLKASNGTVAEQSPQTTPFSLKSFTSDEGDQVLSRLRKLLIFIGADGCYLEEYKNSDYGRLNFVKTSIDIRDNQLEGINGSSILYASDFPSNLPEKYFRIEDAESQFTDYVEARTAFLEDLKRYQKQDPSIERMPKEVSKLMTRKIVLSDCGKAFLAAALAE